VVDGKTARFTLHDDIEEVDLELGVSTESDLEELFTFQLASELDPEIIPNATDSFYPAAEVDQTSNTNSWQPGCNISGFIACSIAPIMEQAQVLIANCTISLKRLPQNIWKLSHSAFPPAQLHSKKGMYAQVAAQMPRIPAPTVVNALRKLSQNSWQPVTPAMCTKATSEEKEVSNNLSVLKQ